MAAALLLVAIAVGAPMVGAGSAASGGEAIVLRASVAAPISPGTSAPVHPTASNMGSATAVISAVRLVDIDAEYATRPV
ncbi:MAG: hypothetical protein WKF96_22735 [Solirubrobacteraceae bacterium]